MQKNNNKEIMLGNMAVARAAIDEGVQFVSTYPGTPASEIGNIFFAITQKEKADFYFEFSVNEKIAVESMIGASFAGLKCLTAMKNFGLNVASDSLLPFVYAGANGPAVILVADDPSCHSSAQSEENSRAFAYLGHIPILEPSDCQESYDFTRLAFSLSEKFKIPVMIRLTTRVAHQRSIVKLGEKKNRGNYSHGLFIKNKKAFVTMPPRVLEMKEELIKKISLLSKTAEKSKINFVINEAKNKQKQNLGIIASSAGYLYAREAMQALNEKIPILKLGFFYPLPDEKIKDFIKDKKQILIVEELEGYLEKEVAVLAKSANHRLKIFGKDLLPVVGEIKPEFVIKALSFLLKKKNPLSFAPEIKKTRHLPRFCNSPVCPYWKIFAAVKQALPSGYVFGGDIGCYMIAALPPLDVYDYMISMGSSFGIGHGIAKANKANKVVAFMGDGTFFHSGMLGLLNAVYNQSDLLAIILDNRTTAMTGHQINPGADESKKELPPQEIKMEEVIRALGVKNLTVVDPNHDFNETVEAIKSFAQKKGPSVIISRHICALLAKRQSQN